VKVVKAIEGFAHLGVEGRASIQPDEPDGTGESESGSMRMEKFGRIGLM
jgi:hypothetical protein